MLRGKKQRLESRKKDLEEVGKGGFGGMALVWDGLGMSLGLVFGVFDNFGRFLFFSGF